MREEKIKFAKRAILFLVVAVLVMFTLNLIFEKAVISQMNMHKNLVQYEPAQVVFFGDSHPARSVNPEYIKNSFNFAVPAETYEQTYFKVRAVIDDVDTVVLPIDLHSFINYRDNPYTQVWYWDNFMSLSELHEKSGESYAKLWFNAHFPVIGNGNQFKRILFDNKSTEVVKGWQVNEEVFADSDDLDELTHGRVEKHFGNRTYIIDDDLLQSFLQTVVLAEKKGKSIVLIRYPVSEKYLDAAIAKGIDIDEFYDSLYSYLPESKSIVILDYHNFTSDYKLFSDADHLNRWGAKEFSKQLDSDLRDLSR